MIILAYFITMTLCFFEGVVHQILYSRLGPEWLDLDEHVLFRPGRILYGLSVGVGVLIGKHYIDFDNVMLFAKMVCYGAGSWFSFSFFHNGGYGLARAYQLNHKHNVRVSYLKAWAYTSASDTAKISLDFQSRLYWFLFGLIFVAVGQFVIGVDFG